MNKSMGMSSKLLLLVAIAVLFGATMVALSVKRGEPGEEKTHHWSDGESTDRKFIVKPGEKLVLEADEGDVSIIGNDSEELAVHIVMRGSDSEARKYHI